MARKSLGKTRKVRRKSSKTVRRTSKARRRNSKAVRRSSKAVRGSSKAVRRGSKAVRRGSKARRRSSKAVRRNNKVKDKPRAGMIQIWSSKRSPQRTTPGKRGVDTVSLPREVVRSRTPIHKRVHYQPSAELPSSRLNAIRPASPFAEIQDEISNQFHELGTMEEGTKVPVSATVEKALVSPKNIKYGVRGHGAFEQLREKERKRRRNEAATKIKRVFRGHRGRKVAEDKATQRDANRRAKADRRIGADDTDLTSHLEGRIPIISSATPPNNLTERDGITGEHYNTRNKWWQARYPTRTSFPTFF